MALTSVMYSTRKALAFNPGLEAFETIEDELFISTSPWRTAPCTTSHDAKTQTGTQHTTHTPSHRLLAAIFLFISASLWNNICFKYFEEISYLDPDLISEQELLCIRCLEDKKKKPTTNSQLKWRTFAERELQESDLCGLQSNFFIILKRPPLHLWEDVLKTWEKKMICR